MKGFGAKVVWTTVISLLPADLLLTILPAGGLTKSIWLNPNGQFLSGNSKTNCVYPADSLAALAKLEAAAGTTFNCVLLYNTTNPTWADWTNVWWARPPGPDTDWMAWKRAVPGRRIIITQSMVPDNAPSNWRVLGAAGRYNQLRDAVGDQSCPKAWATRSSDWVRRRTTTLIRRSTSGPIPPSMETGHGTGPTSPRR